MDYQKDIDGLRAIAVLMVLLFHFDLFGVQNGGFLGVDVFFVISGYLITGNLLRLLDEDNFSLSKFYIGRIRRLAPALFATLFLVIGVGLFILFPGDLQSLSKQIVAAQFYVSNVYYWRTMNYFGLSVYSSYLLHTWSLAVEEQFYLFYPLGLSIAHRVNMVRAAVLVAIVGSFLLNLFFVTRKPEAAFYLLPTRAWELLIGGLVYQTKSRYASNKFANGLGVAGILLVAVSFAVFDSSYRVPGFCAVVPVSGSALILLAGRGRSALTKTLLTLKPLIYVGKISYPLYLVHWPIAVFSVQIFGGGYNIWWRLSGFAFSFVVASSIYHVVESPIRRVRLFRTSRALFASYASGLLLTLGAFFVIMETGGVPQRFPPEAVRLASFAEDKPPAMSECETSTEFRTCIIGAAGRDPKWYIFGDSHAWAARPALEEWLQKNGQSAVFSFRHSCLPLRGVHLYHDRDACFAFNEAAYKSLAKNRSIDRVLLVSIWRQAIDQLTTSNDTPARPKTSKEIFAQQLAASLRELSGMGKRTFIWEPMPTTLNNVPQSMARASAGLYSAPLEISESEYQKEFSFFFDELKNNSSLISGTFSPAKVLCDRTCASSVAGAPVFFDNNHMTASLSRFWAERIDDQLKQ